MKDQDLKILKKYELVDFNHPTYYLSNSPQFKCIANDLVKNPENKVLLCEDHDEWDNRKIYKHDVLFVNVIGSLKNFVIEDNILYVDIYLFDNYEVEEVIPRLIWIERQGKFIIKELITFNIKIKKINYEKIF